MTQMCDETPEKCFNDANNNQVIHEDDCDEDQVKLNHVDIDIKVDVDEEVEEKVEQKESTGDHRREDDYDEDDNDDDDDDENNVKHNLVVDEDATDNCMTDVEVVKEDEPTVRPEPVAVAMPVVDEDENYETTIHPKLKKILKIYRNESHKNILGPQMSESVTKMNQVAAAPLPPPPPPPPPLQQVVQSSSSTTTPPHVHIHQHHAPKHDYDFDNWSAPPPNSLIKHNSDTLHQISSTCALSSTNVKCDAYLHGERITCFIVGGEKRLCLPEMLNYVLKDFTVQQINSVCEKLHIYCSRCTNEQLDTLKMNRLLPMSAPSCGLISLSDAERLCHILLNQNLGKNKKLNDTTNLNLNTNVLKVYHRCFGRTYGIIHTQMYSSPNSQCIECDACHLLYSPQNFVVHTHKYDETRIVHWGFNSANWRLYMQLVNSYKDNEKHKVDFEAFKKKFSNKRKSIYDDDEFGEEEVRVQQNSKDKVNNENDNSFAHHKLSPNKILCTSTPASQSQPQQSTMPTQQMLDDIQIAKKLNNSQHNHHNHNHHHLSQQPQQQQQQHHNVDLKELHYALNMHNSTDKSKLLNDLLVKPMSVQQQHQQDALVYNAIHPTTTIHHTNSSSIQQQQQQQHLNQKLIPNYLYSSAIVSNRDNDGVHSYAKKFCKGAYGDDDIETLVDSIRNEIDLNVKSANNKERLVAYVQQLQETYEERVQKDFNKNRFELQDIKQGLHSENESLKSRLKIVEIENQLLRNQLAKIQHQLALYSGLAQQQQHHRPSFSTDIDLETTNLIAQQLQNSNSSASTSPQQQAAAIALISLNSPNSSASTSLSTSPLGLKSYQSSFRKPSPFNNQQHQHHLQHQQQQQLKAATKLLLQSPTGTANSNYIKCETIS